MHTDLFKFKYVFYSGSDKISVAKITTFKKVVLDSKWTLASHTFTLVADGQQIRTIRTCKANVTKCSLLIITMSRQQKDVLHRYGLIHRRLFPAQLS